MTKKIIVIAAALTLAACGSSSNSSGSSGSTGTTGTPTSTTSSSTSSTSSSSTSSTSTSSGSGSGSTSSTTGSGSGSGSTGSGSGSGSTGIPTPPTLGTQIDRMGRPAVNTALTDPFDNNPTGSESAIKDAYNADSDPTDWVSNWTGAIASNMAVYDGVNVDIPLPDGGALTFTADGGGTSCGDQALTGGDNTDPIAQYGAVAGVLADDQLYLNVKNATCQQYLAVEFNAESFSNTDCGGRTPTEDVVDVSYSLLAEPALVYITNPPLVTDGIASDAQTTGQNAPSTTFPFMGAPN